MKRERDEDADVRGRNATHLASVNRFEADKRADFDEAAHRYTISVEGVPHVVNRSVTSIVGALFPPFDADACVEEWFAGWKRNRDKRYVDIIDAFPDDASAKEEIKKRWKTAGNEPQRLGTLLHLYAEETLNGMQPEKSRFEEVEREVTQLDTFFDSEFGRGLTPFRTEMTVFYNVGPLVVSAGQIDALYKDSEGNFVIVDWKRVKAKQKLTPSERGFRGATGFDAAEGLPDTSFWHYSLQTSIYNLMLNHSHGIDAGERMYLVRVHSDREAYQLIQCADLRERARSALDAEERRLRSGSRPTIRDFASLLASAGKRKPSEFEAFVEAVRKLVGKEECDRFLEGGSADSLVSLL